MTHGFGPVYDSRSKILILGSFPSVKSREQSFYYGHPRNRFWPLLSRIYAEDIPPSIEGKREFLHRHHIALWDVIEECDIIGSSDASIQHPVPADVPAVLAGAEKIQRIYTNGSLSHSLYQKWEKPLTRMEDIPLPSTSPANAAWSIDRLYGAWKVLRTNS